MTISFEDAERLRGAGFTVDEVERLSEAETRDGKPQPPIDLDSPVWQRVLANRRDWVDDKVGRGWTLEDIEDNIRKYYAVTPKRTPFDFLKAEYKPVKKRDFWVAIRERSQRKIKATLKDYF